MPMIVLTSRMIIELIFRNTYVSFFEDSVPRDVSDISNG